MDSRTPASKAWDCWAVVWLDSMLRRTSPHRSDSQLAVKVALTLFLTSLEVVLVVLSPPSPREPYKPTPTVGDSPARLEPPATWPDWSRVLIPTSSQAHF
ncbi:hypothetical protein ACQR3P_04205 [Rhodococcus sp. IEGM1300]